MSNPKISNVGLVTRYEQFAITSHTTIDGSTVQAEGTMPRGTLLVKANAAATKWHQAVHGTDTLAPGLVRILQDDRRVVPGTDIVASAYFGGFMRLSTLQAVNAGYSASELAAAGFAQIESDEVQLK